jgi:predicted O-linked N-acetylglucosamine transferase (SPINDLY family)
LASWVAESPDEYLGLATAWAADLPRLAALRHGLREQVVTSPVMDTARFARHFADAIEGMWHASQS